MLPTPRFLNKQQTVSAVLQDVTFYIPSFVIPTPFDCSNVYFSIEFKPCTMESQLRFLTGFVHRVRITLKVDVE